MIGYLQPAVLQVMSSTEEVLWLCGPRSVGSREDTGVRCEALQTILEIVVECGSCDVVKSLLHLEIMTETIGALRPGLPGAEHWPMKFGRREVLRIDPGGFQMW